MLNLFLRCLLTSLFCFMAAHARAEIRDLPSMTVYAPVSMTEIVSDLARHYSAQADVTVITAFGTSQQHMDKLQEGDQVDVIISNDPVLLKNLRNQGLLDIYTQTRLCKDGLVVVVPTDEAIIASLTSIPDNAKGRASTDTPGQTSEAADDGNPIYSQRPLTVAERMMAVASQANKEKMLRIYADVRTWLLRRPLVIGNPESTYSGRLSTALAKALLLPPLSGEGISYALNSRDIVQQLRHHPAIAIAYRSDALNMGFDRPGQGYHMLEVDAKLYEQPVFEAYVVAGENMERARNFIGFLQSAKARDIIQKHHCQP